MKRLMQFAASVGFVGALVMGMLVTTPSEASAAPCGLSQNTGSFVETNMVYYEIRNCHNYPVHRELDIAGWWDDAECHYIGPGRTVSGQQLIPGFAAIRGIKPC